MNTFHYARDAKEFVISRILEEAQREGTPLSELERKLLYVSAAKMSQSEEEICAEFDCNYDESSYEQKIAKLIKRADRRCLAEDDQGYRRWRSAVQLLSQQDNYIGVMIARANLRPRWDLLKLIVTAVLIVFVAMGAIVLMDKWGIEPPSREAAGFWFWAALITVAVGYYAVRLIVWDR